MTYPGMLNDSYRHSYLIGVDVVEIKQTRKNRFMFNRENYSAKRITEMDTRGIASKGGSSSLLHTEPMYRCNSVYDGLNVKSSTSLLEANVNMGGSIGVSEKLAERLACCVRLSQYFSNYSRKYKLDLLQY